MPSINETRFIFLYEFKRETSASKTSRNINEAFGENLVSRATAKRWFKKFKEGDESLENKERGRPDLVDDNEELKGVVEANPRQTWLDKNEDPKQFPKPQLTAKKVVVFVWWSCERLLHYEFPKHGGTINSELYCQLLDKVHQKLSQKRPSLVNIKGPILLHDNEHPHISRITL
uniref:Histone-lysine N-methyltransferase SETMAR (inferred by orthology to a human protein) n=1 Tax=Strongyloides venezuelensis TaxID=75913 RepID=A0A0K0FGW9_STRVS